jgi:hypothetical protein
MEARKLAPYVSVVVLFSCASATDARNAATPTVTVADAPSKASASPAPADKIAGSDLTDNAPVAFRADFTGELGNPWNVFGALNGNREVKGGKDGLWIKIADAERKWDAVGARTAKLKVEGDYDLRGRFRDFSAKGDGSAKLIVVDAGNPRGEAAYVERVQIEGKNLFKFGGEVEGSLENWGFVPTDATGGDLRIVRLGRALKAYARPDERSPWKEFAQVQEVPKSMPRVVKFGVKLSSETHKSAQVRWVELTLNGQVVRTE